MPESKNQDDIHTEKRDAHLDERYNSNEDSYSSIHSAQSRLEKNRDVTSRFLDPNAPILTDRHLLRDWWHGILRDYERYSCYAIFLMLPFDKEAIRYLVNFGRELDLISGENCLLIALGKTEFRRSGFDEKAWNTTLEEYISEGYSIKVAQLFDINLLEFPCLVVFQDIRSPNHIVVTLKGLTVDQIATQMRSLFSVIQYASSNKQEPLGAIESHRDKENFLRRGNKIISKIRSFAGKTFEIAIEAWIKAIVK